MPAATKESPAFQHGDRTVFVLIPTNQIDSRFCVSVLEEQLEGVAVKPNITNQISLVGMPLDSVLYVMHPIKLKQKGARGRPKSVITTHLSRPIEVKEAVVANKSNYRALDNNKLSQIVSAACLPDPQGRFFRAQVTGEGAKDPAAVVLKLTDM